MPARIVVETGITSGTKHWIDKPVIRIGRDTDGDICLPSSELPDRALTLEFNRGVYRVYNRCKSDIVVAQQTVPANGCIPLNNSDMLELPDGTKLRLELDLDPSPAPRPVDEHAEEIVDAVEVVDAELKRSNAAKKKSSAVQLAVILFCGAICVLLLTLKQSATSEESVTPTFDSAVETFANGEPLKLGLQHAESLLLRGKADLARTMFADIRDALLADHQNLDDSDTHYPTLKYVEYRLGQL